jgi:rhodanese-related sulfurtransferase
MKKWLVFLLLVACGEKQSDTLLGPQDFDAKFRSTENAILLDVRTPEEIAGGKIDGAENIIWDESFADKLTNLEHKPIFVYCGSGIRSAKAATVLKQKGYDQIYELKGGMKAWRAAGLPVTQ